MPSPLVSALKHPPFLKLWAGQCISALGDRFTQIALLSLVLHSDTSWEQAKITFCAYLPWFLFGPFAGVLVERWPRKWLMITSDLVRAALVLALLTYGLQEGADLSGTYPILLAMGLMTAVFSPAKSASLPDLVAPALVLPSGALLAATGVTATAVGSVLAGMVLDNPRMGYAACLSLDALTYLVSAVAVMWIAFPKRIARPRTTVREVVRDFGEGFREIGRNGELRKICAFLFVFWFVASSVQVVSPNFGKEVLGLSQEQLQEGVPGKQEKMTALGKILAVAGLGLLIGAVATAVAGHRISRRAAYFIASAGMGASILAVAFSRTMPPALAFLFLSGLSGGTLVSRIDADILKVIDPGIRGRVFAANGVIFAAALLLPLLPIGWLSKHVPAVSMLGALAALLLALGGLLLRRLFRDAKAGQPILLPPAA